LISRDDYCYHTRHYLLRTIPFKTVFEQVIDWAFDGEGEQERKAKSFSAGYVCQPHCYRSHCVERAVSRARYCRHNMSQPLAVTHPLKHPIQYESIPLMKPG